MKKLISPKIQAALKSGSIKTAFTNEKGAVDLASIMVGIIVLGIISGIVAAVVFAVIPWSQNNAAKNQLDSIVQAENTAIGFSADTDGGQAATAYAAETATNQIVNNSGDVLFDGSSIADDQIVIKAAGTGESAKFGAIVVSKTGAAYYATNASSKGTKVADVAAAETAVDAYLN